MNRLDGPLRGALGDRLCALLYDHPMTLEDVGLLLGVTGERVRQRLVRCGHARKDSTNPSRALHPYDASLVRRLATTGAHKSCIAWLAGISASQAVLLHCNDVPDGRTGRPPAAGRRPETRRICYEIENLVLVDAWRNGATLKDLAALLRVGVGTLAYRLHRLRRDGYDLPLRRKPTRGTRRVQGMSEGEAIP